MAGKRTIFFDIESRNVGRQYGMEPRDFFRLGQYAEGRDGDIILEEDYDTFMDVINSADLLIGHNILSFDLPVLFGKDSTRPLELAFDGKVLDTFVWTVLVDPPSSAWTDRFGHRHFDGDTPIKTKMWLGLEETATRRGLPGKFGSLRDLAKEYQPKGTAVRDYDYSLIPLDDPRFREYAQQDVVAGRALAIDLLNVPGGVTPYIWREMKFAAICAQNMLNGFRVNREVAQARVDELAVKREEIMSTVVEKYGLPTEGKSPWATTAGKAAIFAALADYGITPETREDWPKTATDNPSLGGEALIGLTEGTPAEDLGIALATLKGQRSLAQLALDSQYEDGFAHPDITALQRSGRLSTTNPGLTVWTARGPGAVEKSYFMSDSEDQVLVEFDYSQADARIVAAYSGDEAFKLRFAEGIDAHELTGRLVFGDEVYDSDPYTYRQIAKMLGHAYAYRAGPKTLARNAGQPLEVAQKFVYAMQDAYPKVTAWQEKVTAEGRRGYVINDWGRKMIVDKDRAYTQAPAMYGQSGTRELMADFLLRLVEQTGMRLITRLKAQVHDAVVFSLDEATAQQDALTIQSLMATTWKPQHGGQLVEFIAEHGPLTGRDWYAAGH